MRGCRSSVVLAFILLIGVAPARAAAAAPGPTKVVNLGADLDDLAPDGRGVQTLLGRRSRESSMVVRTRLDTNGVEPATPFLDLPTDADLNGARLLPGGGALAAYTTRGDGYVGNELRVVVDSAGGRYEQRLNSANTQESELGDAIAVGPTGTLAVPFTEEAVPYTDAGETYAIAVRPPGAAAFLGPQPIVPLGAQGVDVPQARTFLGPDGGGWIFLLPSGQDWRAGGPVIVLARRIEPGGQLGVLLHLPVPITRPVNTNVLVAGKFTKGGRLIAAFSGSGYEHDKERAVVWTQTFAPSTVAVPRRSMIVHRLGGYDQYDNIDLRLDASGHAAVIAQTHEGLRVFRRRGAGWTPGPQLTTTRHTWTAQLVRLSDGRSAAVWLQPYDQSEDRSHLMVAAGHLTDRRWVAHQVPGIGRPGLQGLDRVVAFGDDDIAAPVHRAGQQLVLTHVG